MPCEQLFVFKTDFNAFLTVLLLKSYTQALRKQPIVNMLPAPFDVIVPGLMIAVGQTFVLSSTWMLGITGTFLGDYFGILMDEVSYDYLSKKLEP